MTMTRRKRMSLLTKEKRRKYFDYLGIGEYNKANILKFQLMAFSSKAEHDGRYGRKTDIALRHWYNVEKHTKNFKPNEFKCPCGRCTGYPVQMKAKELKHIQAIRDHYGKPMTITSALRCEHQNNRVGGSKDSRHLEGRAVDFYMQGVTDTLQRRINAIAWICKLPNHRYTYGNGCSSITGYHPHTPNMGNALHTDTK